MTDLISLALAWEFQSIVTVRMLTLNIFSLVLWPREILKETLYKVVNRKPNVVELPTTFPRPWQKFTYFLQVRHSDSDNLYHSNQASYFQFCMDAATEGARQEHFRFLKHDLLSYPIESIECLFKGESGPGDELTVHVWEDHKLPHQLFCHIHKKDNVIWEGKLRFSPIVGSKM